MTRITLTLNNQERAALTTLAQKEFRDPRAQAALIIRRELEKQGLIESLTPKSVNNPRAHAMSGADENKLSENREQT
jgi:hypothetical protein